MKQSQFIRMCGTTERMSCQFYIPTKMSTRRALLVQLQLQRAKVPTLTLVTENQVHNNMTGCVQNVMSHRGLWIIQHIHLIRHHQWCLQMLLLIALALGNKDTSILPHLHHTITLAHRHHSMMNESKFIGMCGTTVRTSLRGVWTPLQIAR